MDLVWIDLTPAKGIDHMKTISLLTLVAAFGLIGIAPPAQGAASTSIITQDDTSETARGLVKSIDKAKKTFVITSSGEQAKDITITVNDQTVYMKDGKASTMEEVVKVGTTVTVTHKKGSASKVESFTTP
jgi:hypothetical protein